ncbi:MAG: hypothetical protein ACOYK9_05040, partial [Chlamydiia bacterium]
MLPTASSTLPYAPPSRNRESVKSETLPLDETQQERWAQLSRHKVHISADPELSGSLENIEIDFQDLLAKILSGPCFKDLYLVGGAASWVIGGFPFGDLDLAMFDSKTPEQSYAQFKDQLLLYIQEKVNEQRLPTAEKISDLEVIWRQYFYKSTEGHLCLSFGNVDLKFPKSGVRSHLFDHDAVGIKISKRGGLEIKLVPNAEIGTLSWALDSLRKKRLVLSSPETARLYHFRVFQKLTEGFEVDEQLIAQATEQLIAQATTLMIQDAEKNPHFIRSLSLFSLNHLSEKTKLLFVVNVLNILQAHGVLKPDLLKSILVAMELEQVNAYGELLVRLGRSYLENPTDCQLRPNGCLVDGKQLYLPKPIQECFQDLYQYEIFPPVAYFTILRNWHDSYRKDSEESARSLHFLRTRAIPELRGQYLENRNLVELMDQFERPYIEREWAQKDPLEYTLKSLETTGADPTVIRENISAICRRNTYTQQQVFSLFSLFSEEALHKEKRVVARKFLLDPKRQPDFFTLMCHMKSLFGESCYDEALALFPTSFLGELSSYIVHDGVSIEEKKGALAWVEARGLVERMSRDAIDRYNLIYLTMPLHRFFDLFVKRKAPYELYSWLQYTYNHHPSDMGNIFSEIGEVEPSLKNSCALADLIYRLEFSKNFSIETYIPSQRHDLPFVQQALDVLQFHFFQDQLPIEEIEQILDRLELKEKSFFKPSIHRLLCESLSTDREKARRLFPYLEIDPSMGGLLSWIKKSFKLEEGSLAFNLFYKGRKIPHIKSPDFLPIAIEIFQLCPNFVECAEGAKLALDLIKSIAEEKFIKFKGKFHPDFYFYLLEQRGLAFQFSGSITLKKEYISLFYRKLERKEPFPADSSVILTMCREILECHSKGIEKPLWKLLQSIALEDFVMAEEVLKLYNQSDTCRLQLDPIIDEILHVYPKLQKTTGISPQKALEILKRAKEPKQIRQLIREISASSDPLDIHALLEFSFSQLDQLKFDVFKTI